MPNSKTRPLLSEPPITQLMSLQILHIDKVPIRLASDTSESSLVRALFRRPKSSSYPPPFRIRLRCSRFQKLISHCGTYDIHSGLLPRRRIANSVVWLWSTLALSYAPCPSLARTTQFSKNHRKSERNIEKKTQNERRTFSRTPKYGSKPTLTRLASRTFAT